MIGSIPKGTRERVEVALGDFKGRAFVDVRVFYTSDGGETFKPSPRGCTVRPDQVGALIRLLQQAEADAHARGLIGGGEEGRP